MKAILFLGLICFSACQNFSKKNNLLKKDKIADSSENKNYFSIDSALEDKISDTLIKLSFIKKAQNYIDSFSNHKHGIAFLMDSSHEKDEKDQIVVSAGFNDTDMFKTYYTIYVNSKTFEIKIWDAASDKNLPLKRFEKKK